jgi:hypothetical protein
MTFGLPGRWVDVKATKRATPILKPFWPFVLEVLVSEDYQTALGDKQCQLRFSTVVQLGKLDAFNFGADLWSKLDAVSNWSC